MTPIKLDTKHKDYKTSSDGSNHKSKDKFKLAIGFILFEIIFCESVFDYDLCENNILKNGFECAFKNENDGEYAELLDELYCTLSEPTDTLSATTINFSTPRIVSREKHLVLKVMELNLFLC